MSEVTVTIFLAGDAMCRVTAEADSNVYVGKIEVDGEKRGEVTASTLKELRESFIALMQAQG